METEDKKLWRDTVIFMQEDIKYYSEMLTKSVPAKEQETDFYKNTIQNAADFLIQSDLILKNLIAFTNFMDNGLECDDIQCSDYFENYESQFRIEIKAHFEHYNVLKKNIVFQEEHV